jgi:hypothetical protein
VELADLVFEFGATSFGFCGDAVSGEGVLRVVVVFFAPPAGKVLPDVVFAANLRQPLATVKLPDYVLFEFLGENSPDFSHSNTCEKLSRIRLTECSKSGVQSTNLWHNLFSLKAA